MAYQGAVRLGTSSSIKAEQGNPGWGVEFENQIIESQTAHVCTVGNHTRGLSYTTVTHMESAYVSNVQTPLLVNG